MTIAIVVIVAIIVVIVAVGFIFPRVRPHAHLRSDRGRPPTENVSDMLRLYNASESGWYSGSSLLQPRKGLTFLAVI